MIPVRYAPKNLSRKDRKKQIRMIHTSRAQYKHHRYYTRKKVAFQSKPSRHVRNAKELYQVEKIVPSKELATATGCSIATLKEIVRKGEGAYYSSGSRPNQTPQSWGLARLASAISGGKAAAVDFHILKKCDHTGKAYRLAQANDFIKLT